MFYFLIFRRFIFEFSLIIIYIAPPYLYHFLNFFQLNLKYNSLSLCQECLSGILSLKRFYLHFISFLKLLILYDIQTRSILLIHFKMKLNFQEGVEGSQDLKPPFLLLSQVKKHCFILSEICCLGWSLCPQFFLDFVFPLLLQSFSFHSDYIYGSLSSARTFSREEVSVTFESLQTSPTFSDFLWNPCPSL